MKISLYIASEKKEEAEKKTPENSEAAEILKSVIADYQAGLPNNSTVYWVGLCPSKICRKMRDKGEDTSCYLISNLLKEFGYRKRRYSKEQCLSNPENRDAQFNKIAALKRVFSQAGARHQGGPAGRRRSPVQRVHLGYRLFLFPGAFREPARGDTQSCSEDFQRPIRRVVENDQSSYSSATA